MAEDYEQKVKNYGNRAQSVKRAGKDRRRLMEIRRAAAKNAPPPPDTSGELAPGLLTETLPAMGQEVRFDQLRKEGKNPGYNLGLSADEIAYNQAVRQSLKGIGGRVDALKDRLGSVKNSDRRDALRDRLTEFQTRRQNFKRNLFAPTGPNAGVLPRNERLGLKPGQMSWEAPKATRPKPPARPGMGKPNPKKPNPKNPKGPTGGFAV